MKKLLLLLSFILAIQLACLKLRENLFEGSTAAKAVAACTQNIAGSIQAVGLEITKDTATIRVRRANNPDEVDEYVYSHGLCKGPEPVRLNNLERAMSSDPWIFSPDEINLAAMPTVVKDALASVTLEGGKVTKITIKRELATGANESREKEIRWTIEVQGTRESASASANARGEIVGVDLSGTSRAAKQNYLDPQTFQEAIREVKKAFGGRLTVLGFTAYPSFLWFKAVAPNSDQVNQYQYDLNGVVNKGAASVMPVPKGERIEDRYFQIDDVELSAMEQVLKTAVVKANAKQPWIGSMSFTVDHPNVFSKKLQIFWGVIVADGSPEKSVNVNFDAHGRLLPR